MRRGHLPWSSSFLKWLGRKEQEVGTAREDLLGDSQWRTLSDSQIIMLQYQAYPRAGIPLLGFLPSWTRRFLILVKFYECFACSINKGLISPQVLWWSPFRVVVMSSGAVLNNEMPPMVMKRNLQQKKSRKLKSASGSLVSALFFHAIHLLTVQGGRIQIHFLSSLLSLHKTRLIQLKKKIPKTQKTPTKNPKERRKTQHQPKIS